MAKYVHNDVPSGYTSVRLNDELEKIETAINDQLDRKGGAGNQMEADLDMNSNDILNAYSTRTEKLYLGGELVQKGETLPSIEESPYPDLNSALIDPDLAVGDKQRVSGLGDFEIVSTNPDTAYFATVNGFLRPLENTYSMWSTPTLKIRVPSDFATLQEAVDDAFEKYLSKGNGVEIIIESGHSPATGIYVEHGDYSGITISSVDPTVTVDAGFGTSNTFIEGNNARMPVLNCLVSGNAGAMGFGYKCYNGSIGYITAGNGVTGCWQDGLAVRYGGAACYARDTVWTGNALNGTTSSGIIAWAAFVDAKGADVSNSGYYGAQAAHSGILNFEVGIANNCGRYGVRASDCARVNFNEGTANNNAVYGVYAFNNCMVNFRDGTATGNGTANITATSSHVVATDAILTGSLGDGAIFTRGSTGDLFGADLSGAVAIGLNVGAASMVTAGGANVSNAGTVGVFADGVSSVGFENGTANNCGGSGIAADNSSTINARGATADDCGSYGAKAWYGGQITLNTGFARRAGTRGVYAFSGGKIIAKGADARTVDGVDNTNDFVVIEGSEIIKHGGTGGVSKTINTLTTDGIIYG